MKGPDDEVTIKEAIQNKRLLLENDNYQDWFFAWITERRHVAAGAMGT